MGRPMKALMLNKSESNWTLKQPALNFNLMWSFSLAFCSKEKQLCVRNLIKYSICHIFYTKQKR